MKFLERLRLSRQPRRSGSGRIWDNVNSGGHGTGAPTTRAPDNSTTPVQENYFTPGPNPEPYLVTGEYKDPYRLHAPYIKTQPNVPNKPPTSQVGYLETYTTQKNTSNKQSVQQPLHPPVNTSSPPATNQREQDWDDASWQILQKGEFLTPSQRYYNERTPLPEFTTPSVPSHSVIAGRNSYFPAEMKRGWYQAYVPDPGMHFPEVGATPPLLLSAPLSSTVVIVGNQSRTPIKNAKAPKRKRSA